MGLSDTRSRKIDEVGLELTNFGRRIDNWTEYTFNSHYLTPTDAFSFTLAGKDVDGDSLRYTAPFQPVTLTVGQRTTATGYIDSQNIHHDRSGGTVLHIEGRDRLAQAVDSVMDPRVRFAANQTLEYVLASVFTPYGFGPENFSNDNTTNRNIITGATRGQKTSKKGRELKSLKLHQLQPYPNEGVFNFASRLVERHGLRIWLSADGQQLVVSEPDYLQEPAYRLRRKRGGDSNIISGGVVRDGADQPTMILATATGAGGDVSHSKLKRHVFNPFFVADHSESLARHPESVAVQFAFAANGAEYRQPLSVTLPRGRPCFLVDSESRTGDQLAEFCRREMSNRAHKATKCSYTVEGHTCDGAVWSIDTIVDVDDDIAGIHGPMWVMARTLKKKSRGAGTTTTLELVPPHTLAF